MERLQELVRLSGATEMLSEISEEAARILERVKRDILDDRKRAVRRLRRRVPSGSTSSGAVWRVYPGAGPS